MSNDPYLTSKQIKQLCPHLSQVNIEPGKAHQVIEDVVFEYDYTSHPLQTCLSKLVAEFPEAAQLATKVLRREAKGSENHSSLTYEANVIQHVLPKVHSQGKTSHRQ